MRDVTHIAQECRWQLRELIRTMVRIHGTSAWGEPFEDLRVLRNAVLETLMFGDGDSCEICGSGESGERRLIVVPSRVGRSAVGEAAIIIRQPENGMHVWHHEFPNVKDGCCRLRFLDFFGWPRMDGYEDLPYYLVRIESMDGYPSIAGSLGLVNASDVKVFVEEEKSGNLESQ